VNCTSNQPIEILQVLGIEAARQALLMELRSCLESMAVNYRHIVTLYSYCFFSSFFIAVYPRRYYDITGSTYVYHSSWVISIVKVSNNSA
jgi:hypothetical protein